MKIVAVQYVELCRSSTVSRKKLCSVEVSCVGSVWMLPSTMVGVQWLKAHSSKLAHLTTSVPLGISGGVAIAGFLPQCRHFWSIWFVSSPWFGMRCVRNCFNWRRFYYIVFKDILLLMNGFSLMKNMVFAFSNVTNVNLGSIWIRSDKDESQIPATILSCRSTLVSTPFRGPNTRGHLYPLSSGF